MGGRKFYTLGIGIFDFFCSCDLDLDPMTFVYELDPYSLKLHRMYMNFLRQCFRKLLSNRHRQTGTTEIIHHEKKN